MFPLYSIMFGPLLKIKYTYILMLILYCTATSMAFFFASNVASNVASSPDKERRRRLSSSELHTAILQACVDFESLEAIANKVGKSLRYLKNRAIPIMVAEGLLEREYPNMPKHPHQRYRAKKR